MIQRLARHEFFVSIRIWLLVFVGTWFCLMPMMTAVNPAAFTSDESLYALLIFASPAVYLSILLAVTLSPDDRDRSGIPGLVPGCQPWQALLVKLGWAVFSTLMLQAAQLGVVVGVIGSLRSRPFDWRMSDGRDPAPWLIGVDLLLLCEVGAWGLWWASLSRRPSTALIGTATCVLGLYKLTSLSSYSNGGQSGWWLVRLVLTVVLGGCGSWLALKRIERLREQLPPQDSAPSPLEPERESASATLVTVPPNGGNRPRTLTSDSRRDSESLGIYFVWLGIALASVVVRFGSLLWLGDPYRMRLPLWLLTTVAGVLAMRAVHPLEPLPGKLRQESESSTHRLETSEWLRQVAVWGLIAVVTNAVGLGYSWLTIRFKKSLAVGFLESIATDQWVQSHSFRAPIALGLFLLAAFGAGLLAGTCFRNGHIAISAAVLLSGFTVNVMSGSIYWYAVPIWIVALIPMGLFLGSWLCAVKIRIETSNERSSTIGRIADKGRIA